MIVLTNIRDVSKFDYDEVWSITRSNPNSRWMTWVPNLAPSWDLFRQYRRLKEAMQWNQNTFETVYRPIFTSEMESQQAKNKLSELIQKHNEGKKIAIVCFCQDPNLCHRKIISEILNSLNVENILK